MLSAKDRRGSPPQLVRDLSSRSLGLDDLAIAEVELDDTEVGNAVPVPFRPTKRGSSQQRFDRPGHLLPPSSRWDGGGAGGGKILCKAQMEVSALSFGYSSCGEMSFFEGENDMQDGDGYNDGDYDNYDVQEDDRLVWSAYDDHCVRSLASYRQYKSQKSKPALFDGFASASTLGRSSASSVLVGDHSEHTHRTPTSTTAASSLTSNSVARSTNKNFLKKRRKPRRQYLTHQQRRFRKRSPKTSCVASMHASWSGGSSCDYDFAPPVTHEPFTPLASPLHQRTAVSSPRLRVQQIPEVVSLASSSSSSVGVDVYEKQHMARGCSPSAPTDNALPDPPLERQVLPRDRWSVGPTHGPPLSPRKQK